MIFTDQQSRKLLLLNLIWQRYDPVIFKYWPHFILIWKRWKLAVNLGAFNVRRRHAAAAPPTKLPELVRGQCSVQRYAVKNRDRASNRVRAFFRSFPSVSCSINRHFFQDYSGKDFLPRVSKGNSLVFRSVQASSRKLRKHGLGGFGDECRWVTQSLMAATLCQKVPRHFIPFDVAHSSIFTLYFDLECIWNCIFLSLSEGDYYHSRSGVNTKERLLQGSWHLLLSFIWCASIECVSHIFFLVSRTERAVGKTEEGVGSIRRADSSDQKPERHHRVHGGNVERRHPFVR